MRKQKRYKCPVCSNKIYLRFGDWANHIDVNHPDLIPEDWTPARYLYFLQTGMREGHCVECKQPTDWNEGSQKYERYCKNPACKQKYIKRAKSRMVGKYGKEHILDDPSIQRKMQAAKHISGKVKFDDGGYVEYVGTYEKEFLEMLNTFGFSSNDIISPSPNTYYYYYKNDNDPENEGEKFYIPDFFIPSLNLEIEIKTQMNTHHKIQDIDKVKEKLKDEMMMSIPSIRYMKLSDKDYTSFFDLLINIREESEKERIIVKPAMEEVMVVSPNSEKLDLGLEQAIVDYGFPDTDGLTVIERYEIEENRKAYLPILEDIFKDYVEEPTIATEFSSNSNSRMKAIYIVPMYTGSSPLTKIIKGVTGDEFSHVCIGFNIKLEPIYSFGSTAKSLNPDIKSIGFVKMNPSSDFFRDNIRASYEVWHMEVTPEEYEKMLAKVKYVEEHQKQYGYDWLGLIRNFFGKKSERSFKYFCSGFVADVINAGRPLPKTYSEYRPQDMTRLDNITMIAKGDDFYKYDWKEAKKNLAKVKVQKDIIDNSSSPATEALNLAERIGYWRQKLFPSQFVGGKIQSSRYLTLNKVIIDQSRGIISIQNINITLLLQRIQELYGDKKVKMIFECMYSKKSIIQYNKKRISRSAMKVTALETPIFFALELNVLFMELYEQYNERTYYSIAETLYQKSWINNCDAVLSVRLNTDIVSQVFSPSYILKPHQKEFIEIYPSLKDKLHLNGYLLAFDQGLGKTITSIALSVSLKATRVYIVCPNSMRDVWKDEISKYIKDYANPVLADREIVVCGKITPTAERIRSAKFIIVNNEAIKSMHPFVVSTEKSMLIIDEIHNFRNNKGSRVQDLLELKEKIHPNDILLMSGTPIKAAPAEIVPAMRLLDPLFTPEAANIYAKCFDLDSTMAMSIVKKRFGYIMYRKTKAILDMPSKTILDLRLMIKDPSQYIMSVVKKDTIDLFTDYYNTELGNNMAFQARFIELVNKYSISSTVEKNKYINWVTTVNTLKEMELHELDQEFMETYLQCYVFPNINSELIMKELKELERKFLHMKKSCMGRAIGQIYPPRRTSLFTSLFDENKDKIIDMIQYNTRKTVIFSQLLGVIHHISEELDKVGIGNVKVVGSTNNRIDIINKFREDDNVMVLLATSQTLGTGVTLVEANQMFFFGPPWRSTDFDQCCDRIYRIGQTSPVTIYNVILDTKEFNLSDRMNKILNWSGEMFGAAVDDLKLDEESTTESMMAYKPAEEAFMFNKKNMEFNMDNLDREPGRNMIFVTGYSGSGKSTLANELKDKYEPSVYIELDCIKNNHYLFDWGTDLPIGHKIIQDFIQKKYGGEKRWDMNNKEEKRDFVQTFNLFMEYIREYAESHCKIIFIIEGVQIAFNHDIYLHDDDPLVIMGTSAVVSSRRGAKRDHMKFIPKIKFNHGELGHRLKALERRFKNK